LELAENVADIATCVSAAERMIGINTPEMYFYYVDQAIRKALLAMKS
jgi:hypothetical protein